MLVVIHVLLNLHPLLLHILKALQVSHPITLDLLLLHFDLSLIVVVGMTMIMPMTLQLIGPMERVPLRLWFDRLRLIILMTFQMMFPGSRRLWPLEPLPFLVLIELGRCIKVEGL